MAEDLKLEVLSSARLQQRPTTINLPVLRFLPDGAISEQSVTGVALTHVSGEMLWIVQSRTGLAYEVRDEDTIDQITTR